MVIVVATTLYKFDILVDVTGKTSSISSSIFNCDFVVSGYTVCYNKPFGIIILKKHYVSFCVVVWLP